MNCPMCEKEMILSGNIPYEEFGMPAGDGLVHDWVCEKKECNCEGVLVFEKIDNAEV